MEYALEPRPAHGRKAKGQDEGQRYRQQREVRAAQRCHRQGEIGACAVSLALLAPFTLGLAGHRNDDLLGEMLARPVSANLDGQNLAVRTDHIAGRHHYLHDERQRDQQHGKLAMIAKEGPQSPHRRSPLGVGRRVVTLNLSVVPYAAMLLAAVP
jgi:hypothetical protein